MNRGVRSIAYSLAAALMLVTAMPMTAQAGTLTIYNDNCKTTVGLFKTRNWVKVHVDTIQAGGTDTWVKVPKSESRTVSLIEKYTAFGNTYTYYYVHEAQGTTGGDNDVKGTEDSRVTCRTDWIGVCQCLKDGR